MNTNPTTTTTRTTATTATTATTTTSSSSHRSNPALLSNLDNIRDLYLDCIGRQMPRITLQEVAEELKNNPDAYWWYEYAINEAAAAPRPSWQYVRAIMNRLRREGRSLSPICWDVME